MARQADTLLDVELSEREELEDVLRGRADHKGIDRQTVERTLGKIDMACPATSGEEWVSRMVGGSVLHSHAIHAVLLIIDTLPVDGAEEWLEGLEPSDVVALVDRIAILDYLADPGTPFYTVEELVDRTNRFLDGLVSGDPARETHWLADRLASSWTIGRFLEYRRPGLPDGLSPIPVAAPPDINHDVVAATGNPPGFHRFRPGVQRRGFSGTEQQKARAANHPVKDLQVRVLRSILGAAPSGAGSKMSTECGDLMIAAGSATGGARDCVWLRSDLLAGIGDPPFSDARYIRSGIEEVAYDSSPFLGVLEVMAHFEQELSLATMSHLRRAMDPSLFEALSASPMPGLYLRLPGESCRRSADEFVGRFIAAEKPAAKMTAAFRRRVASDLFTAQQPVRRHQLHGLLLRAAGSSSKIGESRLSRTRSGWEITYGKYTAFVEATRGVEYLAWLLERQGIDIKAIMLVQAVSRGGAAGGQWLDSVLRRDLDFGSGAGRDDPEGESQRTAATHLDRGDDRKELALLRRQRSAHRLRLADAEESGRTVQAHEIREALDGVERGIRRLAGKNGDARTVGDPAKKERQAVQSTVRRALTAIAVAHPALGEHLQASVKAGTVCSYKPLSPVRWVVSWAPDPELPG